MRRGRDVTEGFASHNRWTVASAGTQSVLSWCQHVLHLVQSSFDTTQHFAVRGNVRRLARADRFFWRRKYPVVVLDVGPFDGGLVQSALD